MSAGAFCFFEVKNKESAGNGIFPGGTELPPVPQGEPPLQGLVTEDVQIV